MRLLNVKTVRLEEFFESEAPPYAILSHTWGQGEVSFEDIQHTPDRCTTKPGYEKILKTCQQASKDNLKYAWIDACCIDKSSSAELSEAINSMFRWYEQAEVCYAFLADVPDVPLQKSRWFTRGWTLQELLAPRKVVFFGSSWSLLGTREALRKEISKATGIEQRFLCNGKELSSSFILQASIAARMSWASARETTRSEDMAYCLLGIFGINMPLIYGEGTRAFRRLQEEIIKHSNDHSIFAWNPPNQQASTTKIGARLPGNQVLALSPAAFADCGSIISFPFDSQSSLFNVTNQGVQIRLPISKGETGHALLQCYYRSDPTALLAIRVRRLRNDVYEREEGLPTITIDHRTWGRWSKKMIYLSLRQQVDPSDIPFPDIHLRNIPDAVSIQRYPTLSQRSSYTEPKVEIFFLNLWDNGFQLALRCQVPNSQSCHCLGQLKHV